MRPCVRSRNLVNEEAMGAVAPKERKKDIALCFCKSFVGASLQVTDVLWKGVLFPLRNIIS